MHHRFDCTLQISSLLVQSHMFDARQDGVGVRLGVSADAGGIA